MGSQVAELSMEYLIEVETKDVPDGYKLTEVGVIPEDWDIKKLEQLVIFRNGAAHEKCINDAGEYIVVNSKFISTGGIVKKNTNECRQPAYKSEVLMVMSDVPNGRAIAKCYWVEADNIYTINQRICALKHVNIDSMYLFYKLNRNPFYLAFDDGAKQTNLRRQDVLNCPIPLPFKKEQTLIAKKQAIKTATMQQLLTGRTRLPEFAFRDDGTRKRYKDSELGEVPEDWGVVALAEVGQTIIGLTYSPDVVSDYGDLVLRSSNVQNNQLSFNNNVYVNMDLPSRVIVYEGDILICVRNGSRQLIGKCALIDKNTQGSAFGAFMSIFRTKSYHFVFYQFQSNIIQNQINQITNKDMSGFKILLPKNHKEQTAIAAILADMDSEIQTLEQRLAKTRQIKQGMMQELLTGKTRLVKPAKEALHD